VGKLLLFYKAVASHDGQISIVNIPPDIYQDFKRVQLDEIFSLQPAS
jgi:anti-anti-sigma regulatory factor